MEERKLNEQESLELIAQMIQESRQRLQLSNGNVCLLWGYTSIAVAALVWIVGCLSPHPGWNFLWFLIWIIGGTLSHHIQKHEKKVTSSYVDRISTGLWSIVGWCTLLFVALCLGFMLTIGADCWALMLVFGMFVIGFAASMQGIIIQEKSLVWGGATGIASGAFVMCCLIADITLSAAWVIPLFMFCFVCMMVIPGHLLNAKLRKCHV